MIRKSGYRFSEKIMRKQRSCSGMTNRRVVIPLQRRAAGLFKEYLCHRPTGMGMTPPIYGIKNCDTMKKARAWLDSHGVAYDFHDYKIAGIGKDKLKQWSDDVGWETLLNRAGTTFKKLPDGDKEGLNERKALALM